jgi:hypothetical protein
MLRVNRHNHDFTRFMISKPSNFFLNADWVRIIVYFTFYLQPLQNSFFANLLNIPPEPTGGKFFHYIAHGSIRRPSREFK